MLQEEATSRLDLLPVKQRGAVLAGCLSEQDKLLMSGVAGLVVQMGQFSGM